MPKSRAKPATKRIPKNSQKGKVDLGKLIKKTEKKYEWMANAMPAHAGDWKSLPKMNRNSQVVKYSTVAFRKVPEEDKLNTLAKAVYAYAR